MKKVLFFLMFALFCIPWAMWAQTTLTLHDGTENSEYIPFEGYNADNSGGQQNQMIYPATELSDMVGKSITQMVFYIDASASNGNNTAASRLGTWVVSLGETSGTTLTGLDETTVLTSVYTGYMDCSTGTLTIVFEDGYVYNGGNLLVQFYKAAGYNSGQWNRWYFLGEATEGNTSYSSYNSTHLWQFLPKITFTYEIPATTPKPSGLHVTNFDATTVTLDWNENGSATAWQLCLNDDEENLISANQHPFTIPSLTPLTAYTVKVRSVNGGENSAWTTNVSFNTTAVAEPVGNAWSDNFEGTSCGWELVNGSLTNQWAWGTATNNGGAHALYVSNDGGTTNAYSNASSTIVYAYKLLAFTDGKYQFGYNWLANGESTWDYLRVALVPVNETLIAGTTVPTGFSASALPTSWIALDGGSKLNLSTEWQNKSVALDLTEGNYYLVLAWRNDNSGGSNPPAAVDNVSVTKITCPYDVDGLVVNNITTTGAALSWTTGEATQWQVAYGTASNFENATEVTVNAPAYNITGMQQSTTYYVRVRAYCGGSDFGAWSEVKQFTTACEATTAIGFTENFDDITVASIVTPTSCVLPACWNHINESTNSVFKYYPTVYYYSSSNYANSTPNCLRFYSYYSSYSEYDPQDQYAILPPMNNLAGKQITMQAKGYNANSIFKIGTMTDPEDVATFAMIAEQELTTSYQEFIYNIPATSTGNYVAIMIEAANSTRTGNGAYIDDIVIGEPPACAKPTELAKSNVTAHSVNLTWTSDASAWKVAYKTSQDENFTEVNVNENPYTLSGLTAQTVYTVKVQAVCGDDVSDWSTAVSFTTGCEAQDITYTYDFEEAAPFACWTPIAGVDTARSSSNAHEGSKYLKFAGTISNTIALPQFTNATNMLRLEFWTRPEGYNFSNCGSFSVGYMTDLEDASSFMAIETYDYNDWTSNTYEKKTVDFNEAPADAYIAMRQHYCTSSYYWYVDDVTVKEIPSCSAPTALDATPTANSAQLSWTANSGETTWTVYYKKTSDDDYTEVANVTENPYTLSGLDDATNYKFYVVANCSATETSEPSTTFSFTTPCEAQDITYTYDFEDAAPFICWTPIAGAAVVNGNSAHEGSNYLKFSGTTSNMIALPQFSNATNTLRLEFWTRPEDRTYPSCGSFSVGYMTDLEDASSFVAVATYAYNDWTSNIYEKKTVDFNEAPANAYIAMRQHDCAYNYYWYVDDVTVKEIPSCPAPTGLTVSYTGGDEATVSWTSEATAWNLDVNGTVIPVTENPYTLTDLTLATDYDVKVQAVCGSEVSEWTGTQSFATDICAADDMCELTFVLTDSYGDGWNGNAIKVTDVATGIVLGELTNIDENGDNGCNSGNCLETETFTLAVCDGRAIQFSWVSGNYATETSYTVYDLNGNEIFSGSDAMSAPVNYTVNCASCAPVTELEASVNGFDVTLTWEPGGSETDWAIRYREEGTADWNEDINDGSEYEIAGLLPGDYEAEVRALCGSSVTSGWTSTTFTVECPNYSGEETVSICADSYEWNGETYTTSGDKQKHFTLANGCDSLATLHLTLKSPSAFSDVTTVCANEFPTTFHGVQFSQAGTQTFTIPNSVNCDSVVTLTVNVKQPTSFSDVTTICSNELPYTFHDVLFTAAGTQTKTLTNAVGCDSVVTLTVNVKQTSSFSDEITICDDELPFEFHGVTFQEAGTNNRTLTNAVDCDSVVTLTVNVKYRSYFSDEISVCAADMPYTFHGVQFTVAGTQTKTIPNAAGCDSIMTLTVNVKQPSSFTDTWTVCAEDMPVEWYGHLFTQAGTQTFHNTNAVGCDSTSTLTLYVNTPVHQSYTVDACDSYKWVVGSWSQTYTTPGVKLHSHSDANGCTQVDTLHLTLRHSTTGIDEVTACNSYTWINGTTYTQSTNTPTYTLTNAAGCDSVVTLHLTVNHSRPVSYTITECDSYTWINGITYNASTTATYSHEDVHGCTQVDTLYLTINYSATKDLYDTVCEGKPYYLNGFIIPGSENVEGDHTHTLNLFTINQCDSTVTLHLHVNICDETCGQPITDIDNNSYETMPVHRLCWMTSNLRTTRYSDGTTIPFAIVYSYPYDPNNTDNLMTFGRLYNWTSASKAAAATPLQGVCPDGWRLPTQAEFEELSIFYTETQLRSTDNWIQGAGTNASGFNKQPGGFYNGTTGICERLGASAHFYTADTQANGVIYQISDYSCDSVTYDVTDNPQDGRSIRCVRDLGND